MATEAEAAARGEVAGRGLRLRERQPGRPGASGRCARPGGRTLPGALLDPASPWQARGRRSSLAAQVRLGAPSILAPEREVGGDARHRRRLSNCRSPISGPRVGRFSEEELTRDRPPSDREWPPPAYRWAPTSQSARTAAQNS
ncbi:hypothetical protein MG293_002713 [Ovis ammon polii]|uniref:Uncharacterized protein n=1 Tax=Ovis ammon polii TaxID=230172 RepID=A0AAD4UH71_OVIAM|nr:hypothetical protein MG293_002713 [Ovis ammon polii]